MSVCAPIIRAASINYELGRRVQRSSNNITVHPVVFPIAITLLAALMLLPNLDRSYLWQDEAQHALLSRTILNHGVPMGRDGLNTTSQEQGNDIGPDGTFRYHPWLPFYISAGAFAIFGESTWAARFPFAMIGIITVVATYFMVLSVWKNRAMAVTAAALLTLSVPYLILARQCRYYSPVALFMLLGVWTYIELVRGKRWAPYALAIVATLLMHTLHLYAAVFLGAVVLHMAIWERALWKQVLIRAAIVGVVHIPWVMWISEVVQYSHATSIENITRFGFEFLWRTIKHVYTPPIIVAAVALDIVRRKSKQAMPVRDRDQRTCEQLIVLITILGLGLLTLRAPYPFFRYLSPYPALAAVIGGPAIIGLLRAQRQLGVIIILTLLYWYAVPMKLLQYPSELMLPHNGPIRGIVEHLREHAKPGDVVYIAYGDLPISFYLPRLRVYGPGLIEETVKEAGNATWCIPRRVSPFGQHPELADLMKKIVQSGKFEIIRLQSPDLAFENREDFLQHYFVTPANEPPVHVFHRIDGSQSPAETISQP